jgi:hypothetical protein
VLDLRNFQFRILSFQVIGVDKSSLVPEKLLARTEMLREYFLRLLLDNMPVLVINRIPEFRLPLVDQVYARKIEVLSMPAEECLPTAHVAVGRIDPLHSIGECIA